MKGSQEEFQILRYFHLTNLHWGPVMLKPTFMNLLPYTLKTRLLIVMAHYNF